VLGWQEATSEFAVAEAERDNLREELNEVKLEIKMLQAACDHLVSETTKDANRPMQTLGEEREKACNTNTSTAEALTKLQTELHCT